MAIHQEGSWLRGVVTHCLGAAQDVLYPPRCAVCDATAPALCNACRDQLERPDPQALPGRPGLADYACAALYRGPLAQAIPLFKYGRQLELAGPLGELLAEALTARRDEWAPEALVPVPLHPWRRFRRGFNQAELLVREAGRRLGLPVELRLLRRIRSTPPQVGRSREERLRNLQGAFALLPGRSVAGRRLVLIDDVSTTGATLTAAAAPLVEAGAAVFGLSVAWEP
ncbi:MAG: ComF family protein [Armatimonadetes bacterium]|nr:ComF family protein [Armatimonadota bacterium]